MVVEAPVLDGDERLRQIGRQLADGDGAAAGLALVGEQRPSLAMMAMLGGRLGTVSSSMGGSCEA